MKQDGSPSDWEPIGVPVLALHAQESSCLNVSVEMRRTEPSPSAVNDDEVVCDPPAARVRVEDTPDSGPVMSIWQRCSVMPSHRLKTEVSEQPMRRQRSGYLRHKYQKLRLARHLGHFGYMLLAIISHLRIRSAIRCSRISSRQFI
jgi:hypothetical protein